MKRSILAVWFVATVLAVPAQAYPTWDLHRAAVSVTAKAATFQDTGTTAFLPDVTATYSLTSALGIAGSFHRDFANDTNLGAGDLVFRVAGNDRWQAGASVGVVGYSGVGKAALGVVEDTSMRYGLRGSWVAWRDAQTNQARLYGIAQVHLDPNQRPGDDGEAQGLVSGVVGLRFVLVGGKPQMLEPDEQQ